MPDHRKSTLSGTITHVFGHRFVVDTPQGPVLADITPKGLDRLTLRVGTDVTIEGEMKPSELKVTRITCAGTTIAIDHKKKPHEEHDGRADPAIALASARAAGFNTLGTPRRKPKHFEVLAQRDGKFHELHMEFDGHIRKTKPVFKDDIKWGEALEDALRNNA